MSTVSSRPPGPPSRRRHDWDAPGSRTNPTTAGHLHLSDDLADWVDELAAAGMERRTAHRLTLVTVVLVALREMPSFLDDATEHIEAALSDLDTYEVAQVALVESDLDEAWDALAETTAEPISGRCRVLARLCRRNGLRVVAP